MNTILPNDLISLTEAYQLLQVSRMKLRDLVNRGYLRTYDDLLDRRVKLVSRAEVLALQVRRKEAA